MRIVKAKGIKLSRSDAFGNEKCRIMLERICAELKVPIPNDSTVNAALEELDGKKWKPKKGEAG